LILYPEIRPTTALTENYEVQRKVVSIPHSGTRGLKDLLGCHHVHLWCIWPRLDAELMDNVVIMPLRDPQQIWISWLNRAGTKERIDLNRFEKQWRKLVQLDRIFDITYVPVDHPARDEIIQDVAHRLQIEVNPTWEKVGHMGGDPQWVIDHPDEIPEIDWDFIYNLPMVSKFYEQES
jgi:hypothetical protein